MLEFKVTEELGPNNEILGITILIKVLQKKSIKNMTSSKEQIFVKVL